MISRQTVSLNTCKMFILLGRLGRNGRPGGRNFALNGTQGEVGVSLKKKKKNFFFFFFFLGRLIFILSPHKCKLW